MVAKIALIGNGAIEGRKMVLACNELKMLNKLCDRVPALDLGPRRAAVPPLQERNLVQVSNNDDTALSHPLRVNVMSRPEYLS